MSDDTDRANVQPTEDRVSVLWRRVKEHHVAQWAAAYAGLAYAIQHAVVLTGDAFEWPRLVQRISMLLLILGAPVVVTLAWYQGARASRGFSRAELSILSSLLVIGALLFYVFVRPNEGAAVSAGARQASVTAPRRAGPDAKGAISLAVLPFVNLSSDKEQEFFSDGMTEEITAALAKIPELRVVARTSAFEFKGKNVDIRTMGQQLGATHLIEGSVRKAGDRLRITAQLIKSDDGTHVWAEDYDRQLTDVFAIQEDIARAITASLRVPLGLKQGTPLVANRNIDAQSYEDYLRARALVRYRAGGVQALKDGIAILEAVVMRDSDYAPAWAQLALAYALMPSVDPALSTGTAEELRRVVNAYMPKAEDAAQKAIQLDPNLAEGYSALGRIAEGRGRPLLADEYFSKALVLDANNPDSLSQYGNLLGGVGRVKDGLTSLQRALALEPLVPNYIVTASQLLAIDGQTEAAIAMIRRMPPTTMRGLRLAQYLAGARRFGEAADALLETPASRYPPGTPLEDAVRLLRAGPATSSPQSLPPLKLLDFVYLYAGDPTRTMVFDERIGEAGFFDIPGAWFYWQASAAPVRKSERFKAYARKQGFVDYWKAKGWPEFCHPVGADDFACE